MSHDGSNCFVLTGGPGSGKSTLIEALAAAGFRTAPEAGRAVIRDQEAIAGRALPWVDPLLFAEMMLARDLQSYADHAGHAGPVFFDRGIPDVIGYVTLVGLPVPDHMRKAAALYRYNARVFICPPWPEIFTQDRERRQTLKEAERTYEAMIRTYADCGYRLIEVPCAEVTERRQFVLGAMSHLA
jgi:predicted ATPase